HMIRKLSAFLATFALLHSSLAMGQAKPPDVPEPVDVPATYAAGTTLNLLGDGVNGRGSPMPVTVYELDDIPSDPTGWTHSGAVVEDCTEPLVECKSRFTSNGAHVLYDDPIRNYGDPGASHCHQF